MRSFVLLLIAVCVLSIKAERPRFTEHGFHFVDLFKDVPLRSQNQTRAKTPPKDDVLRFFILGDFGQLENYFGIRTVGAMMDKMAANKSYDYITTVGDNFYKHGLEDITYRMKPFLITQQFQRENLRDLPIHVTLGNHDCHSNYLNEIYYSDYNKQWNLPTDYYELVTPMKDNPEVNFVNLMLNSCKLFCLDNPYVKTDICDKMHVEIGSDEVLEHYAWLEDRLEYYSSLNTTAWLAVSLHHIPFKLDTFKMLLLPMLRKYNIDFIFTAHAHHAEYANMAPDYETRFPGEDAKILKNCTDDTEIFVHTAREHTFKKNETLHQFMSGNGGHTLGTLCPFKDQDGEVYFQSYNYYGVTSVEATSKKVTVTFNRDFEDMVYRINIEA